MQWKLVSIFFIQKADIISVSVAYLKIIAFKQKFKRDFSISHCLHKWLVPSNLYNLHFQVLGHNYHYFYLKPSSSEIENFRATKMALKCETFSSLYYLLGSSVWEKPILSNVIKEITKFLGSLGLRKRPDVRWW